MYVASGNDISLGPVRLLKFAVFDAHENTSVCDVPVIAFNVEPFRVYRFITFDTEWAAVFVAPELDSDSTNGISTLLNDTLSGTENLTTVTFVFCEIADDELDISAPELTSRFDIAFR